LSLQSPKRRRSRLRFRFSSTPAPHRRLRLQCILHQTFAGWIAFVCFACLPAHSQDTQFLPEVDAYLRFNPKVRVYIQAKDDRAGGDPQQFTFGPSIQFNLKPLVKLRRISAYDLDDSKSRTLVAETGYRIITAPNTPDTNRAEEALTSHLPLVAGILLSDRNRADLQWQNGVFTWRYRNRLTLQRTLPVFSYHLIPYVAAEPFYESQYSKWSTTELYVGCLFPVGKHVQFESYYEHENNTGKHPNKQNNFVGVVLYLYFSREKSSAP